MAGEQKILIAKCKELGVTVSGKERLTSLKKKLEALGVNVRALLEASASQGVVVSPEVQPQPGTSFNQAQLTEVVEAVLRRLPSGPVSESSSKEKNNKKKSKKRKQVVVNENNDSSSSEEVNETEKSGWSSDEDTIIIPDPGPCSSKKKSKKHGKKFATPSLSLAYSVQHTVKKCVLEGKYVPLYKLLPGCQANFGSLMSVADADGSLRISMGDSVKDRKLARQPLEFPQMMLALLKFKDILQSVLSSRCKEIDSYIANLTMICNKYSGLAYWYYHVYFWDKASECSDRGVVLDWSVLDSEALHAAIASNCSANFCNLCQSWYHHPSKCPFNFRDNKAFQQQPKLFPEGDFAKSASTYERTKAYYKGKEICNRYNFGTCNTEVCHFLHMCRFCNKFDHPVRKCDAKGK